MLKLLLFLFLGETRGNLKEHLFYDSLLAGMLIFSLLVIFFSPPATHFFCSKKKMMSMRFCLFRPYEIQLKRTMGYIKTAQNLSDIFGYGRAAKFLFKQKHKN